MNNLKILFGLFSVRQKFLFFTVIFFTIISSGLDLLGVVSIAPLIDIISNQGLIEDNFSAEIIGNLFNLEGKNLTLLMGFFVFTIIILSSLFKVFAQYLQISFSRNIEYHLSKRLISAYLNQNYEWFLDKNTSDLGKNILIEIANCTNGVISSLIKIIWQSNLSIFILLTLFVVNGKVAIQIFLFTSTITLILLFAFRNYVKNFGSARLKLDKARYSAVGELFGAVKEIKFSDLENNYISRFLKIASRLIKVKSLQRLLLEFPRPILEGLIFGAVVIFLLSFIYVDTYFYDSLPLISVYLFALYKLIPAMNNIYMSISNYKYYLPSLRSIDKDLKMLSNEFAIHNVPKELKVKNLISFKNISYSYPNSTALSLKNINLNLKLSSSYGFVGLTGSGKTTLIDILLGLLTPTKGELNVDKILINSKNKKQWQKNIGYVCQTIYLTDDTIAANIAFSEPSEDINWEKLYYVSKIACLDQFVCELKDKYLTKVGERGIKLSGGQKQRIGIARALYKTHKILVLDEATNALDTLTERKVMDNIFRNCSDVTLIIIAHRISTIKKCEQIIVLNKGEINGKGSYQELIEKNKLFKNLTMENRN